MYSRKKLEEIFQENDLKKLDIALSSIGDELEYSNLTSAEVISIVNYFFGCIRNYTSETIIENILNICLRIMNAHTVFRGFNLDLVLPYVRTMSTGCSSYVLTFLGFSGDIKYEKTIESFLQNDSLKEDAEEALLELRYSVKRNYTIPH